MAIIFLLQNVFYFPVILNLSWWIRIFWLEIVKFSKWLVVWVCHLTTERYLLHERSDACYMNGAILAIWTAVSYFPRKPGVASAQTQSGHVFTTLPSPRLHSLHTKGCPELTPFQTTFSTSFMKLVAHSASPPCQQTFTRSLIPSCPVTAATWRSGRELCWRRPLGVAWSWSRESQVTLLAMTCQRVRPSPPRRERGIGVERRHPCSHQRR